MTENFTERATVARMFELINGRNLEELERVCSDSGFLCGLRQALDAFPDLVHHHEAIIVEGGRAAAHFTATGTHLGRFGEMPPTHRRIDITGVLVMRLRDEHVDEALTYLDTDALMQQLTA